MLDQQGQDSYVILVRLVRLEKSYELDQVGYDSQDRLVTFDRLDQFRQVSQFRLLCQVSQGNQFRLISLDYIEKDSQVGQDRSISLDQIEKVCKVS